MKKFATFFLVLLMASQVLKAQSIDEARKSINNGRIASAKETLQKLLAANGKNAEAIYWLGQAHLSAEDIAGAKKTYQDALNGGLNDPWIWVGMGHIALLENNKSDARQRFESAIAASMIKKKENPAILNAIGRANADGSATIGDPIYGIDKLKRAAELDVANPDIYINIGIIYVKQVDGTNAYEAYTNALRIDPNNAMANFRMGKIFKSQGNTEKFLEYYNRAVAVDPNFAPGYLELYDYYSNRDVNKAGDYLQKYVATSDKDCSTEFLYADYLFRSGKYNESLEKAKAMENGACKTFPKLKLLYAYNYDRLGNNDLAKSNIESYMGSTSPDKIQSADYLLAISILKKTPGSEESIIGYLKTAVNNDTSKVNRVKYIDTIASLYNKLGNVNERFNWLQQGMAINPNPNNLNIYYLVDASIAVKNFVLADSMSLFYITKYPAQEYGYQLRVRAAKAADSTGTGSCFAAIQQYIDFLSAQDAVKNAGKIKDNYIFMASMTADKIKDYPAALDYVNKILAIDPADSFGTSAKPVLEKAVNTKSSGGGATKKTAPGTKKGK